MTSAGGTVPTTNPSVVTVGTFDGVHAGHRALVERARALARALHPAARTAALVFDPNPIEVLRPAKAPPRLTTFDQKRSFLLAAGADEVVRLEPTAGLLAESPEEFLQTLKRDHGMAGIVEGPDFRFGHARAGSVETLRALGPRLGFSVDIVEPVTVILDDHTIAPARSTMVRWLLEQGRVSDAARILGRPHTMTGQVVPGDRRGRAIGYPTANLASPCMAPADGVYAGRARLADGREFDAAISVGTKPTFGEHGRAVEAVLLGVGGEHGPPGAAAWAPVPGLPEYGWTMELSFAAWIREQVRFASLEALLEQMERDCARIRQILRIRAAINHRPQTDGPPPPVPAAEIPA